MFKNKGTARCRGKGGGGGTGWRNDPNNVCTCEQMKKT
jgi:hypothetical protein